MANLYTGKIDTEGQYQTLASKTGLTFESNKKYVIQVQNSAWLREGTTGEGFYINNLNPIAYTTGENTLYIKTSSYCVVNIAE